MTGTRDTARPGRTPAVPSSTRSRRRPALVLGGAFLGLVAAVLTGVGIGAFPLPPGAVVLTLLDRALDAVGAGHVSGGLDRTGTAVLLQLRLPRVLLAVLVGAGLAVSGASYQGVFRNPLVDPYLLGAAAGAGLGATLAIAYAGPSVDRYDLLPLAAFAGAAFGVACSYALGHSAGSRSPAALVLAGVTVVSFLTAIQTFVQQQHAQSLQEVYSWILGRLDTAGWHDVALVAPYIGAAAIVIVLFRRALDVLSVGDEEASSLGLDVSRTRLVIVVFATVGTA